MKKLVQFILLMVPVITVCQPVDSAADDACIFDVIVGAQPLIGLYFDSGPDMEQVVWSGSFNYLENWGKAENEVFVEVLDQEDRSVASAGPDDTITYFGFTNPNGYAVYEDNPGQSDIICRTPRGNSLLEQASRAGVIQIQPTDWRDVLRATKASEKKLALSNLRFFSRL